MAKIEIPNPKKIKIGSKTVDSIFIEYAYNSNAYRFLVHESVASDITKGTVIESRNAIFFENIFPCKEKKEVISNKRPYESTTDSIERSDEPRRSKRARVDKSFGPEFLTYMLDNEPRTIQEPLSNPEALFLERSKPK